MSMHYSLAARFPIKKGISVAKVIDTIRTFKYTGELNVDIFEKGTEAGYHEAFGSVPLCRIEVNDDTMGYDDAKRLEDCVRVAAKKFADWERGLLLMFLEYDEVATSMAYGPAAQAKRFVTNALVEHIVRIGDRISQVQRTQDLEYLTLALPTEDT
jgi:hypothetical protein